MDLEVRPLSTHPARQSPASSHSELQDLLTLFAPPSGDAAFTFSKARPDAVPKPYDELLVHAHHMTVTVERFHGTSVDVKILARHQDGDTYSRQILLALQTTRRVVQYGVMRINFQFCSPPVRAAIVAGTTPLGRILIEHNVLTRIEPQSYLRVIPCTAMMNWFNLTQPTPTYGRLAMIHCDDQPAVELLEIVAPEPCAEGR